MNILITGGTGFIGYHLIKRLESKGHNISCVIRSSSDITDLEQFSLNYVDISKIYENKVDFSEYEIIYHLASIRHKWGTTWKEYKNSGQIFTKKLLEKSKNKISHFIFCSSVSVYGYPKTLPISEKTPKLPKNLYGRMKYECENLIRNFSKKNELPYTILQPTIVYGKNDPSGMMTRLIKLIYHGKYITVGKGENSIQLIYTEDLIDIFEKIGIEIGATNTEFIITNRNPISINKLVKLIRDILNKDVFIDIKIPKVLARFSAFILENFYHTGIKITGNSPVITQEKIDTMTKNVSYSINKAMNDLNFSPKYSYKPGITKLIKHLIKEHKWKV